MVFRRATIAAMNRKNSIQTDSAPQAIGAYSQAIRAGDAVYISGQIPLDPTTMEMTDGIENQIRRVFQNVSAICQAAGGEVDDIVKLTVYLTDLAHFSLVNEAMAEFFSKPYPARAAVQISALPKGAQVEVDAVMSAR